MSTYGPNMRLELRQKQTLVMTPALQQALKILQMSTLELKDQLTEEMMENPTLEEDKSSEDENKDTESALVESLLGEQTPQELSTSLEAWKEYFGDSSTDLGPSEKRDDKQGEYLKNAVAQKTTLYEHLVRQWVIASSNDEEKAIGEDILGNLDEDGYLRGVTLQDIAQTLGSTLEKVEEVLRVVQSLDPLGVGARDLQECLLLQLGTDEKWNLSRTIIKNHFKELQHKNAPKISRTLKIPLAKVKHALDKIMSLEPKPGRPYSTHNVEYVIPDLLIEKNGDEYDVRLTNEGMPRLRLSPYYLRILKEAQGKGATAVTDVKDYLRKKVQSALWFIKSIEERQKTLLRVAKSLFIIQKGFLDHGVMHLKPLRLVDVAEDIGVHESTVARAVRGKYIQTPRGIYKLKFFFAPGLSGGGLEAVSARAIQGRISELIKAEDKHRPFSDSRIVELLADEKMHVARRTVAKYRDLLKILPASQRKTHN